jgi:release factor glutamine methyltransferase
MMDSPQKTVATLRNVLKEAVDTLSSSQIERARLEAEVLLAHVLEQGKEYLLIHPDRQLTDFQEEKFHQLIERRCRKEPLAYIVGHREFWSLDFKVNSTVLIPRPETEGVIEQLLNLVGEDAREIPLRIMDVGTGSGILSIVAALELQNAQITAVDNSKDALEVARENAIEHKVVKRIEFSTMDLKCDWNLPLNNSFDYILSNPPYIPSE